MINEEEYIHELLRFDSECGAGTNPGGPLCPACVCCASPPPGTTCCKCCVSPPPTQS